MAVTGLWSVFSMTSAVAEYIVKRGDTLSHIAKKFYGYAYKWPDIYRANKDSIDDPDLIYIGQKLLLPGLMAELEKDFLPTLESLINHPEIKLLIAKLKKREIVEHPNFISNFRKLINNPRDRKALAFFGISDVENISTQLMRLKTLFIAQTYLNPEDFVLGDEDLKYIHRLLISPKSVASPKTFWQKRLEKARAYAEEFIQKQQAGPNLAHLIMLEKDIFYLPSSPKFVTLYYNGGYYHFGKSDSAVLEMARTIKRIKPHSKYINNADPTAGSYNKLIEALR